jgi:hypothetical protein
MEVPFCDEGVSVAGACKVVLARGRVKQVDPVEWVEIS